MAPGLDSWSLIATASSRVSSIGRSVRTRRRRIYRDGSTYVVLVADEDGVNRPKVATSLAEALELRETLKATHAAAAIPTTVTTCPRQGGVVEPALLEELPGLRGQPHRIRTGEASGRRGRRRICDESSFSAVRPESLDDPEPAGCAT